MTMVKHLMDEEGNILSFANFQERFPNVGLDFLTYHGLVSSVMTYQKKTKFVSENSALPLDSDSKPWSVILKRGSRGVYSILNEYSQTPKSVCKWNQLFAELNWGEIFCKPIITTKDKQLRWFQFRILHRLLPARRYLYLRHLTETPMCDFCSHEEETLLHLFWECPAVQSFWSDVSALISRDIQVELNMPLILFGLDQNVQTDRKFDLIILMAKFHIFKSKLQKGKPNVNIFIHSLKQRAVIEKYCIAATDQEERHETQPLSLADLLCLE